mmetsp:Transcript_3148/g.5972  ORF Transcript_3148/g.5972 Transcript_3148/m.5972 type:complete len:157 (+) Transcript_3148:715-1185(+)
MSYLQLLSCFPEPALKNRDIIKYKVIPNACNMDCMVMRAAIDTMSSASVRIHPMITWTSVNLELQDDDFRVHRGNPGKKEVPHCLCSHVFESFSTGFVFLRRFVLHPGRRQIGPDLRVTDCIWPILDVRTRSDAWRTNLEFPFCLAHLVTEIRSTG